MPKCELRILLDRSNRTYTTDDQINGTLEVHVLEDCKCKKLTIGPVWQTSGGRLDCGTGQKKKLFSGKWRAGKRLSYRFVLNTPGGPLNIRRFGFDLEWRLESLAQLAYGRTVRTEETFVLTEAVSRPDRDAFRTYVPSDFAARQDKAISASWLLAPGLLSLLLGAFLAFLPLPELMKGNSNPLNSNPLAIKSDLETIFTGVFFILLGMSMGVLGARRLLLNMRGVKERVRFHGSIYNSLVGVGIALSALKSESSAADSSVSSFGGSGGLSGGGGASGSW